MNQEAIHPVQESAQENSQIEEIKLPIFAIEGDASNKKLKQIYKGKSQIPDAVEVKIAEGKKWLDLISTVIDGEEGKYVVDTPATVAETMRDWIEDFAEEVKEEGYKIQVMWILGPEHECVLQFRQFLKNSAEFVDEITLVKNQKVEGGTFEIWDEAVKTSDWAKDFVTQHAVIDSPHLYYNTDDADGVRYLSFFDYFQNKTPKGHKKIAIRKWCRAVYPQFDNVEINNDKKLVTFVCGDKGGIGKTAIARGYIDYLLFNAIKKNEVKLKYK